MRWNASGASVVPSALSMVTSSRVASSTEAAPIRRKNRAPPVVVIRRSRRPTTGPGPSA